jgi:hypothetical protein
VAACVVGAALVEGVGVTAFSVAWLRICGVTDLVAAGAIAGLAHAAKTVMAKKVSMANWNIRTSFPPLA